MGRARMRDLHLEAVVAALTTLTTNNLYSKGNTNTEKKKRNKGAQISKLGPVSWTDRKKKDIYRVKLALGERRRTLMRRDRDRGSEDISFCLLFPWRDTVPVRRAIARSRGQRCTTRTRTRTRRRKVASVAASATARRTRTSHGRQILLSDFRRGCALCSCTRRVDAQRRIARLRFCQGYGTGHDDVRRLSVASSAALAEAVDT